MKKDNKKVKEKIKKAQKGAVTVFLTIVLVPCIIFVCAFGDISRVELSKAQAESSADLALYSLMSHYDKDLAEYYGLVASCQDIDQFYEESIKYFSGMMSAAGMSETGDQLFIQWMQALCSGDVQDFLKVDITEDIKITAADNGEMGKNAALIEDSIVEFMKYRGPVSIVSNVIERFSKLDFSSAKDVEKNKTVTDAKKTAAEDEQKLLEQALYTYAALLNYQDTYESEGKPSIKVYKNYESDLKNIWSDLENATLLITRYYAGISSLSSLSFPSGSLSENTYQPKDVGIKDEDEEEDGNIKYRVDLALLNSYTNANDINNYVNNVENIAQSITTSFKKIESPSDLNKVRYIQQVNAKISAGDLTRLTQYGDWLKERYAKLSALSKCEPYEDEKNNLPDDWRQTISNAMQNIAQTYNKYFQKSATTEYRKYVSTYEGYINEGIIGKVNNRSFTMTSSLCGGGSVTLAEFVSTFQNKISDVDSILQEQYDRLNIILNGGKFEYNGESYKAVSLNKLLKLAKDYAKSRNAWGNAASSAGTEYGDSEYQLYKGTAEDLGEETKQTVESDELSLSIDEEIINNTITRVKNIMKDIKSLQDALKAFKYGGKKIKDLSSVNALIKAAETKVSGNQSLSLSKNDSAAKQAFSSLINPSSKSSIYTAPSLVSGETGNNPDLTYDCELYRLLNEVIGRSRLKNITNEVKETKKKQDELKKQGDKEESESKKADTIYTRNLGSNITNSSGGSTFSDTSILSTIVGIAETLISGNVSQIRDQLYVCEYAMTMFSYSSYDNQGPYDLSVAAGKNYSLEDFKNSSSGGVSYASEYDSTWTTLAPTKFTQNLTLTNRLKNQANNHAHLAEIEYLLYGNSSNEENLKKAYENIFKIRLILNTVSGYINFYSPKNETGQIISSIAIAVSAATSGIVPIPFTKCLLIGVLAAMESARDLNLLKAGQQVLLYKTSDSDWWASLSGNNIAQAAVSGSTNEKKAETNGLYYSDYMYLFLLMAMAGNSGVYESVLLRIGDLVEANMKKTDGNGDFDLNKSICYFKIDGKLKVKPLLMDLNIVNGMKNVDPSVVTDATGWNSYRIALIRGYS